MNRSAQREGEYHGISRGAGAWFRQPVVWLGAAILGATITGCIVTIVLAQAHADTAVETGGGSVMKVPLRHATATPPVSEAK